MNQERRKAGREEVGLARIVPQTRLLLCLLVLSLPLAGGAALPPAAFTGTLAAVAILAVVAVFDARQGRASLAAVAVALPELVRLQKDREGEIELRVRDEHKRGRLLRLGLALPPEFRSPHETLLAEIPRDAAVSRTRWLCTPTRRGRYALDRCYFESPSPLRLWRIRGSSPARTELRVYPNLFDERKNVAALFLNRGHFGVHVRRQAGQGREFEKLREYVHGDSFGDIHWKASAKRSHPVTKVFQIERTQEIYVVLDASRLSAREQGAQAAFERFVTAALVLGFAAEQQGDAFGLVTFDEKVRAFVRAKAGKDHFAACRDALYTLQPRIVSPDFEELFSFLRVTLRRRALLLILTALDDPMLADSFAANVGLVCRQHLVLVSMLKPRGAGPVFARGGDVAALDDIYRQLGGHFLWHKLRELGKVLQRRSVGLSLLDNERLSAELVAQYLSVKARQLL